MHSYALRCGRLIRPFVPTLVTVALLTVLSGLLTSQRQLSARPSGSGAPPPSRFPADAQYRFAVDAASPVPPWGLNFIAFSGALTAAPNAAALRDAYAAWAPRAALALSGTGAFIYPFPALHVTVANPAPSTSAAHAAWGDGERRAFEGAWTAALRACAPAAPFPLVFQRLRLGPGGVGIFDVGDPTGAVRRARECVAAQRAASPQLGFMGRDLDIVHATVARFVAPRTEGVSDAEVEARWATAAAAWAGGITALCDSFFLVRGNEVAALAGANPRGAVVLELPAAEKR
jgi:hypothetical protein